ncbi:MAG: carbohydrate kinase family protein [Clostridia bacterium]
MKKVFVIGGAAVDITGQPDSLCRMRDSNFGTVRMNAGGVSKNIAKRLPGYGIETELITAIGKGYHAQLIQEDCVASHVSINYTRVLDAHTGTYLCILDEDGDLLVGISDMKILDHLLPDYFLSLLPIINNADMAVLDGNLLPETLEFLTENLTTPIFFDPVSCAKAKRIGNHVGKCYAIKPNRFEAAFLSGRSCDTVRGVYRASDWFIEQGVQRVFISLGPEGVYWADKDGCGVLPALCTDVINTTGAGDSMCAAIIDGCLNHMTTEQCAAYGNSASAVTCTRADINTLSNPALT